jgi:hypothetical protein
MSTPTTPNDTSLGFSGPDRICSRCAQDAHRAANKSTADYIAPNFDLEVLRFRISPIQPRFYVGACWACGDLAHLLPAYEFGVPTPTRAAHRFAAAVLSAWLGGELPTDKVLSVRALYDTGSYWVQFKPVGSLYIHTEATRNPAEAVARFIQAASY